MYLDPAVTYTDIEAKHILRPLSAVLQQAGISKATSDARCIVGLVLGRDDPVLPHETLSHWTPEHHSQLEGLRQRRQTGEPISRMRGWREFWSMRFDLSPATFDPRPDSETVITAATRWARDHRPAVRILDLGTGTGCLLIACLAELPQTNQGWVARVRDVQQEGGANLVTQGHPAHAAQPCFAVLKDMLQ